MKIISLGIFCNKTNRDENFPDYGIVAVATDALASHLSLKHNNLWQL